MKTKILLVNNGLADGGIERASSSLANYFVSMGYTINVVSLFKREHFFTLNESISFIEPKFKGNHVSRIIYLLRMMFYIRKKTKRIKPDVILAFGEWTNSFVVLALSGIRIPIYLSDRMSPILNLTFVHRFLKKRLYKKAAGIIAQTDYAKKILYERTNSKNIRVISNPVNCIDKVECIPQKRIVTVGRLSIEKGHRFLIEAFAQIHDSSWVLTIVGDGQEKEKLEQLVDKLKIKERVIFYGHQKKISLQLSEAQIFVLPSLSEGFPNALLEAMSLPLACISSNCVAGPADIIENGVNGLLVDPGNVEALTLALNRLIENPELRKELAIEAYKIREKLAFERISEQYLNFILQKARNNE